MYFDLYLNPDNYELSSFLNSDTLDNSNYIFEDIDCDINFINSKKPEASYYTPIQLKHTFKKTNEFSILHVGSRCLNANYSSIEKLTKELDNGFDIFSVA